MRQYPRRCLRGALVLALGLLIVPHAHAQDSPPARDTLLITPTTQGIFPLPETGVTLEIGYATVTGPVHLTLTREASASGPRYTITALNSYGEPPARFEMPLIAHFPSGAESFPMTAESADATLPASRAEDASQPVTALIGWPLTVTITPAAPLTGSPDDGRWLVVFDAHGIYAQPAWAALPDSILYLGPLEHYAPDLIDHDLDRQTLRYTASPPIERAILREESRGGQTAITPLPTAARADRYADRFVPEDKGNPGGFMLLGWARAADLPDVVRALRATIPNDPDLPAPGVPESPISLILPFDCTESWTISWGYHHSTPQNRFAVDFATNAPNGTAGQPVYAAHAGTLYLKRFGTAAHLIDTGLSARVLAADGITSTMYGHFDIAETAALWAFDPGDLPDFVWVEIGPVAQGQMIGVAGRTGYATGPHVHVALWSWDQSLYQPVPFGPLTAFERGTVIPRELRQGCDVYHR